MRTLPSRKHKEGQFRPSFVRSSRSYFLVAFFAGFAALPLVLFFVAQAMIEASVVRCARDLNLWEAILTAAQSKRNP
jgi:hypothetical protein